MLRFEASATVVLFIRCLELTEAKTLILVNKGKFTQKMTDRPCPGEGKGGKYLEQENIWMVEEQRGYLRKILFCQHCSVRCPVVVVSLHLQITISKTSPELQINFIQVLPPVQKSHWPDG